MTEQQVAKAAEEAEKVVAAMIRDHRSAAIPALIGACVMWTVDLGGAEVVKGSLRNAIRLADEMDAERRKGAA